MLDQGTTLPLLPASVKDLEGLWLGARITIRANLQVQDRSVGQADAALGWYISDVMRVSLKTIRICAVKSLLSALMI